MSEAPHHDTIDIIKIDRSGGHYVYWVNRLTADDLHSKADIAAVLAWYRAELAALRADAERYRWLRGRAYVFGSEDYVGTLPDEQVSMWLKGSCPMDDDGIDAAIDARKEAP